MIYLSTQIFNKEERKHTDNCWYLWRENKQSVTGTVPFEPGNKHTENSATKTDLSAMNPSYPPIYSSSYT